MAILRKRLSSRSLSTIWKSSNLLVFRSTSVACLVIILVHLIVVFLLSDKLGRSATGHRGFPVVVDAGEQAIIEVVKPVGREEFKAEFKEISQNGMKGEGARKSETDEKRSRWLEVSSNASLLRFTAQSTCRQGHVQGYGGFCDPAFSCLRQLRGSSPETTPLRSDPLPAGTRRKIHSMFGNLDAVHYNIVPLLTGVQWSKSIYGSVGEIGVKTGKFTVVLAHNVDPDAGEAFFVSDNFNVPPPMSNPPVGLTKYQVFSVYMRETGFGEEFSGLRKLHVHKGDPTGLSKQLMHDWNLPQFRMISVDGTMGAGTVASLEWAACVLRDGGIIVIDGVDDDTSLPKARTVIVQFFRKYGHSAFSPFLVSNNKLYISTTNWKKQFTDTIKESSFYPNQMQMNDDTWGTELTYIRIT